MSKDELGELLVRYEKGLCTEAEIELLDQFAAAFQHNEEWQPSVHGARAATQARILARIQARIFDKIMNEIEPTAQSKPSWFNATAISIAIIVVIMLGILLVGIWQWNRPLPTAPKTEQAIYAMVTAGDGKLKEVQLPDGSTIILNKGAAIKYIKDFEQNREVQLSGEAYFNVTTDSLHPFRVITGAVTTTVLGTVFNISHRTNRDNIKVTLMEGKVAISDDKKQKILAPGEQAIYLKQDSIFFVVKKEDGLALAWQREVVDFKKATVEEVVEVLEEKYNIKFTIVDEARIKSRLIYRLNASKYQLKEVLRHITKITDYQFEIKSDGSVVVLPK